MEEEFRGEAEVEIDGKQIIVMLFKVNRRNSIIGYLYRARTVVFDNETAMERRKIRRMEAKVIREKKDIHREKIIRKEMEEQIGRDEEEEMTENKKAENTNNPETWAKMEYD